MTTKDIIADMLTTLKQRKEEGEDRLRAEWDGMLASPTLKEVLADIAASPDLFDQLVAGLYETFGEVTEAGHSERIRMMPAPVLRLNIANHQGLPLGMASEVLLQSKE